MSTDGIPEREISTHITCAESAFDMLRNVWKSTNLSLKLKLRLFSIIIQSVLMCGCENWALKMQLEKRIQSFENNCLQRILASSWTDKITNSKEDLTGDIGDTWLEWAAIACPMMFGVGLLPQFDGTDDRRLNLDDALKMTQRS